MTAQMDMFTDVSKESFQVLNKNVVDYKDSADKVRRGVFAKVGELKKEMTQELAIQKQEIDRIKFLLSQMQELRELVG